MDTGIMSPKQNVCFQDGNMIFQTFFWSSFVPLPLIKWKRSMSTSVHLRVSVGTDLWMVLCSASNFTEVFFLGNEVPICHLLLFSLFCLKMRVPGLHIGPWTILVIAHVLLVN